MSPKRKYVILPSPEATAEAPPASVEEQASLDLLAGTLFHRSRRELIAEAAYYRAERRGFQGGSPEQDWIDAEAEIEALLRRQRPLDPAAPRETEQRQPEGSRVGYDEAPVR